MSWSDSTPNVVLLTLTLALLSLVGSAAEAQTVPHGELAAERWCLSLPERERVLAAYEELGIARVELRLLDEDRSLLQQRVTALGLQLDLTRDAALQALSVAERLDALLARQLAERRVEQRARRLRRATFALTGLSAAALTAAFVMRPP